MKYLFCALPLLLALSAPAARAAQSEPATGAVPPVPAADSAAPSPAQLNELFQVMELEKTSQAIQAQMASAMRGMAESMLPADATAQDRAHMQRLMQEQMESTRELLAWDKLAPIYRSTYRQVFNAAEVQAMIDFYSTPLGRSILHKLPQVMSVAMREMQPMMAELMQDTRETLEREMQAVPAAQQ